MTTALAIIAFAPSVVLIALAVWVYFTQPDPEDYFFLNDSDDWGAQ